MVKRFIAPIVAVALLFSFIGKKIKIAGKNVLFIGDSHTAGYNWGWQDVLARNYKFNAINISKGGITIPQMTKRAFDYLKNNNIPDVAFVYGGANDIYNGSTPDEATSHLQKLVDFLNSKGIKVIVVAGFRSNVISASKRKEFVINYDKFKIQLPYKIQNAFVVSIWNGGKQTDSPDGYHLNATAQSRFADYVGKKVLEK